MAEIQTDESHKKHRSQRSKKLSTRVDLTPMVDLGFLLITFFIFTTTLSTPKVMGMILPTGSKDSTDAANSKVLNLILKENNTIIYYNGTDATNSFSTNYTAIGLRDIIVQKRATVAAKWGNANETTILIKPTVQASYRNIVAVLDEMQINTIKKYVLVEATPQEADLK